MPSEPDQQVAIFFDFENLVLGAQRELPDRGNEAVPAAAVKALCQERGQARIRRAYADWGMPAFAPYQEALGMNGIDLIQVKRFGMAQKNAADIRMAVDAMETLITHPAVSTFVLVAGDGDYSPLVQRLREYGKRVIGVGTKASASPRLVAVCSEYKYWGTLVAQVDPGTPLPAGKAFDIKESLALLLHALEGSADATGSEWASAGPLKNRMLVSNAAFDNANYGAKTFTAFLELPAIAKKVEVRRLENGQTQARRK
jgi:uncharacterized protein (TIGR00288 family)